MTGIWINIGSGYVWRHQAITWTDSDMLIVPKKQTPVKCDWNPPKFLSTKWIWKYCLQNGTHFCSCLDLPMDFLNRKKSIHMIKYCPVISLAKYSMICMNSTALRNFWVNWIGSCNQYETDLSFFSIKKKYTFYLVKKKPKSQVTFDWSYIMIIVVMYLVILNSWEYRYMDSKQSWCT